MGDQKLISTLGHDVTFDQVKKELSYLRAKQPEGRFFWTCDNSGYQIWQLGVFLSTV